jgi:protein-L-isoaspartate(D-aspartate) O-methyltransferase
MVHMQLECRGIRDGDVRKAMGKVPREEFVDPRFEKFAYDDSPLPIGEGQTISQPYVVALMIEGAEIKSGDRVLEVGAGSGYAAAVMSRIAGQVHAIERLRSLEEPARLRMSNLGYGNVTLQVGDSTLGWPEVAPFDAILVSAAGPEIPTALRQQLVVGGRLVMPIGSVGREQTLLKLTRRDSGEFQQQELGAVAFVPLIGEQGWSEDGRRSTKYRSRRGTSPART